LSAPRISGLVPDSVSQTSNRPAAKKGL
jgi:hypothetical protein